MTNKPTYKKYKRVVSSRFLWLISVLAGIAFLITFWRTPVFPLKWTLIVFGALIVVLGLTFLLSIKTNPRNIFTKFVNILLSIVLILGTILIPYEVDKVSNLLDAATTQKTVINIYRMSDSYAQTNGFTKVFSYDAKEDSTVSSLDSLKEAKFITSMNQDRDNSEYAIVELSKEFGNNVTTMDRDTVVDAVSSLYSHVCNHNDAGAE